MLRAPHQKRQPGYRKDREMSTKAAITGDNVEERYGR
jgi:hypothetical protein